MPDEAPSPVRSRAVTNLNAANSPGTINYPASVVAGDELILIIGIDTSQTIGASGWTQLDHRTQTDTGAVFRKTADGSEAGGTFSVTFTTNNRDVAAVVYAIPADGAAELAGAAGASNPVDPPSLSPTGGNRQYLWIQAGVYEGGAFVTEYSDGFGDWYNVRPPGLSISAWSTERTLTASSLQPTDPVRTASTAWIAYTIAVPVTVNPGNFAVMEGVAESSWASGATSQTLNLPSGITAGDLLVAEICTATAQTPSITDWTILDGPDTTGGLETATIMWKVATGSEGASVSVSFTGSVTGSGTCRRYSNADETKLDSTMVAAAASTTVDLPSLTPADGADDILWQIGYTGDTANATPLASPFGFPHLPAYNRIDSGIYSSVGAHNAATVDPESFTIEASRRHVTWNVAIYPAGGGAQSLTGTLFTKAPSFFTGTVASDQNLAGALFQRAPSFFTGTVAVEAQDLTGQLFTNDPSFFVGTVELGAASLTGNLFTKAPLFFAGVVALEGESLFGVLFQNDPLFFQGSLTGGVVSAVRVAREAVVVANSNESAAREGQLAREAVVVPHHFPEEETALLTARLGVVIAISRPHGWHIFDDPPL